MGILQKNRDVFWQILGWNEYCLCYIMIFIQKHVDILFLCCRKDVVFIHLYLSNVTLNTWIRYMFSVFFRFHDLINKNNSSQVTTSKRRVSGRGRNSTSYRLLVRLVPSSMVLAETPKIFADWMFDKWDFFSKDKHCEVMLNRGDPSVVIERCARYPKYKECKQNCYRKCARLWVKKKSGGSRVR